MPLIRTPHFEVIATQIFIQLLRKEVRRYKGKLNSSQIDLAGTSAELSYLGKLYGDALAHHDLLVKAGQAKLQHELLPLTRRINSCMYKLLKQYYEQFKGVMTPLHLFWVKRALNGTLHRKLQTLDFHLSNEVLEKHWQKLQKRNQELYWLALPYKEVLEANKTKVFSGLFTTISSAHLQFEAQKKADWVTYKLLSALDLANSVSLKDEDYTQKMETIKSLESEALTMNPQAIQKHAYAALKEFKEQKPSSPSGSTALAALELQALPALLPDNKRKMAEQSVYNQTYKIKVVKSLEDQPPNNTYTQYNAYDWDNTLINLIKFNTGTCVRSKLLKNEWEAHFKKSPKTRRNDIITTAPWSFELQCAILLYITEVNEAIGNPPGVNTLFHSIYFVEFNKEPVLRYLKENELAHIPHESFILVDDLPENVFLCKRGGFQAVLVDPKKGAEHIIMLDQLNQAKPKPGQPMADSKKLEEEKSDEDEDYPDFISQPEIKLNASK